MKVGLFFGTFNPVHVGHLIIANYMAGHSDLEEVWFIVSPHNPLKKKNALLNEHDRLHWVELGIGNNKKLKASNIEFDLPQPSYTINTLAHLKKKYSHHQFILIMGSDNLETFHKWKNFELILKNHKIYIYKRPGHDGGEFIRHPQVKSFDVPLLNISASFIRKSIKEGKSVQYLLPDKILEALNIDK